MDWINIYFTFMKLSRQDNIKRFDLAIFNMATWDLQLNMSLIKNSSKRNSALSQIHADINHSVKPSLLFSFE